MDSWSRIALINLVSRWSNLVSMDSYAEMKTKGWEVCVLEKLYGKIYIREICKLGFVGRFPELSLFYRLFSQLDSEMICIFPYFCPCEESTREIREIFMPKYAREVASGKFSVVRPCSLLYQEVLRNPALLFLLSERKYSLWYWHRNVFELLDSLTHGGVRGRRLVTASYSIPCRKFLKINFVSIYFCIEGKFDLS